MPLTVLKLDHLPFKDVHSDEQLLNLKLEQVQAGSLIQVTRPGFESQDMCRRKAGSQEGPRTVEERKEASPAEDPRHRQVQSQGTGQNLGQQEGRVPKQS